MTPKTLFPQIQVCIYSNYASSIPRLIVASETNSHQVQPIFEKRFYLLSEEPSYL